MLGIGIGIGVQHVEILQSGAAPVIPANARRTEDNIVRTTEDGTTRTTEN